MDEKSILEEFHLRREKGNNSIIEKDFMPFKRFMALDSRAYEAGAIPEKYKELMGLVGSMVLRCNDCITYHIDSARKAGSTETEMLEAMNIALVIGGSIVIPHLRYALDVMNEVFNS